MIFSAGKKSENVVNFTVVTESLPLQIPIYHCRSELIELLTKELQLQEENGRESLQLTKVADTLYYAFAFYKWGSESRLLTQKSIRELLKKKMGKNRTEK